MRRSAALALVSGTGTSDCQAQTYFRHFPFLPFCLLIIAIILDRIIDSIILEVKDPNPGYRYLPKCQGIIQTFQKPSKESPDELVGICPKNGLWFLPTNNISSFVFTRRLSA
ncbi:hypothetical protein BDZ45DRAFT_319959 [Acephala macrosclerotiorum]|nr:hypothetical protein BDZ45DRAFT_319959 [Acephala macrosclerotiorum]